MMVTGAALARSGRLAALIALAAFVTAGGAAGPLTIATYNIENYTLSDRMVADVYRKDYPKPEVEKTALRAVIRRLNADVIALQEIGGQPYLDELKRDLASDGQNYPYGVVLVADDPDRQIAVLSRVPFVNVTPHTDLAFKYFEAPTKVKRGLFEVRVAYEGGDITLFVVHLKSRFTERTDDAMAGLQRAGEATVVRDRILRIFPDPAAARFLIVGDFNDSRISRPLRAFFERGKTKIADWLPAADSRGEVWSHFYKKEDSYSRVDHILVSPGLLPRVRGGAARIEDAPETGQASDHRPLVVVIE